jgi:gas vesicle protein
MFGFGKKKKKKEEEDSELDESKKKSTNTDKIVMGAILGVAIGSVISMSLAPKKKKKKEKKSQKAKRKKAFGLFEKKADENEEKEPTLAEKLKKIPSEQE